MSQIVTELPVLTSSGTPRPAWKQWIPAAAWLGIISIESTDLLSSAHTGSVLYSVMTYCFGHVNPLAFVVWHHLLRKAGHVAGYAMLSWLLFRAWRATLPVPHAPAWSLAWARVALLMTALVATLDEWHQMFIPSRTGSLRDVLLDTSAAFGAQALIWFFLRGRQLGQDERVNRLGASSSTADTTASAAEK